MIGVSVPAQAAPVVSAGAGVAQMAFSLLLVLVVIFALAWVLRRMQGLRPGGTTGLRVTSGIQVGAKERVLLIQAGDAHLLIGVAPGRVNLLHQFSEAPKFEEVPQLPSFGEALKRALGKGQDGT